MEQIIVSDQSAPPLGTFSMGCDADVAAAGALADHATPARAHLSRPAARHTQCFMCSRIYFGRELGRCPRCGSRSVQHYSNDELNLFARQADRDPHRTPMFIQRAE